VARRSSIRVWFGGGRAGVGAMGISRKFIQGLVLFIALGVSAVLVFGVWKGKTRTAQQPAPAAALPDAEMKLTDMEFTEMQEGKRAWTLRASEAEYFQDEQKTALKAVRITFFLSDGDEIRLESNAGILYAGSKNIEVWDSVRASLPRGYELTTTRAAYDHQKRLISSETPIRLNGADVVLEGSRWHYRISDEAAVLEGGVKASLSFLPKQGKTTSVRPK